MSTWKTNWKTKRNLRGKVSSIPHQTNPKKPGRNLKKEDLGGVIFGCKNSTIHECLSNQIFGLPANHFSYVKNIEPGLPLFLFNYSKRAMHGIFEAASTGKMNINSYGWTMDGSEKTLYPAQVQIRVMTNCHPLLQSQFAPIIKENYYYENHFWLELDCAQVKKLIALFSTQMIEVVPSAPPITSEGSWQMITRNSSMETKQAKGTDPSAAHLSEAFSSHSKEHVSFTNSSSCHDEVDWPVGADVEFMQNDEADIISEKLQQCSVSCAPSDSSSEEQEFSPVDNPQEDSANANMTNTDGVDLEKMEMVQAESVKDSPLLALDYLSTIANLQEEVQELKTFRQEDAAKMSQLEKKLFELESESQQLRDRCMMMESLFVQEACINGATMDSSTELHLDPEDVILLVGGYNGESWLSSLDSFSPSKDIITSLKSMSSVRSYASVTKLNEYLLVIGGGAGFSWYDTVELYNTAKDEWRSLPQLKKKKGSLAAASLYEKIYAIGGGNGSDSFSDVEMFDINVGRWITARAMSQKRFALAAVELHGSLYAVGGYDGEHYLRSGERFDPREHSWSRIESMNTSRGSHSLVALNDKLYAIGGCDGSKTVASVEVYDPRYGKWMTEAPMNHVRGYSSAVVLGNTVFAIGGLADRDTFVEKVEQYKEGQEGWQVTNLKGIGKRCYACAVVP